MASLGDLFKQVSAELGYDTGDAQDFSQMTLGDMMRRRTQSGGLPSPAKMDAAALMSDPAMEPPGLSPAQPSPDMVSSPYEMEKDAFAAEAAARPGETGLWGLLKRGHRIANAPIPGANPEAPTGMAGMEGVLLTQVPSNILGRTAGGGMAKQKVPGARPAPILDAPLSMGPRQARESKMPAEGRKYPAKTGRWWRRMWGLDGPLAKPRTRDGETRATGAPPGTSTFEHFHALKDKLKGMTQEGIIAKDWYPKSSRAILDMTGGNKVDAEKVAQLVAIYSPQNPVKPNFEAAVRAWQQYKSGAKEIHAGPKGSMDRRAEALLFKGKDWEGRKTNNFYGNLMLQIDPTNPINKDLVTVDIHMMRALGYKTDAPSEQQYRWAQNFLRDVAYDMRLDPHQVQAASWTSQKYRREVLSKLKPGQEAPPVRNYDFANASGEIMGQVNMEAIPHPTTRDIPQIHKAPFAVRDQYTQGLFEKVLQPGGKDLVAELVGLTAGPGFRAPGYYQGQLEPGFKGRVSMPAEMGGLGAIARGLGAEGWKFTKRPGPRAPEIGPRLGYEIDPATQKIHLSAGKESQRNKLALEALGQVTGQPERVLEESKRARGIDAGTEKLVELYAAAYGYILRQEGVGYGRAAPARTQREANGYRIDIGRASTPKETAALARLIHEKLGIKGKPEADGVFPKTTPEGIDVINFSNIPSSKVLKAARDASRELLDNILAEGYILEQGNLISNDWRANPNGEGYRRRLEAVSGGSSQLVQGVERLREAVAEFNRAFSREQGWGEPASPGRLAPPGPIPQLGTSLGSMAESGP